MQVVDWNQGKAGMLRYVCHGWTPANVYSYRGE